MTSRHLTVLDPRCPENWFHPMLQMFCLPLSTGSITVAQAEHSSIFWWYWYQAHVYILSLVAGPLTDYLTTSLTQNSTGHIPSSSGLGALHSTFTMMQGESHNLSYCSRPNGVHSKSLMNENEEQEAALNDLWKQVLPTPVASFLHIKTGKYMGTDKSQVAST